MAIAFGSSTNSGVIAATNTTTFNSPNVSGSNTIGWVATNTRDSASATDIDISSITWNGSAMTSAVHSEYPNSAFLGVDLYYIIAPTAGVTSIVVTWAGTIDTGGAIASYFTGVAQTTPVETTNNAHDNAINATDPSVAVTPTSDNSWAIDSVYNKTGANMTVGANQTQIAQLSPNGGGDRSGSSYEGPQTPAGAMTMSWTVNPDDDWVTVAATFKPAVTTVVKDIIVSGFIPFAR